ncbi:hypothetical protein C7999DRAFT_12876 [Corynascus novoguineensis]|uniref:Uncharacterized protein n=1 Tax=Corynascus novoguineensis TaxID=1126955 RepID=A0AAN7CYH3_9PEZI|nr:hypothetical protein C7999DRAFT_12876 [Corynascus novoguineensis]
MPAQKIPVAKQATAPRTTGTGNNSRSNTPSPPKTAGSGNNSRSNTPSPPKTTGSGNNSRSNTPSPPRGSGGPVPPPPPPPPPAPAPTPAPAVVNPPTVSSQGPAGHLLVSLAIFNGYPFKDHWGILIRKTATAQQGIMLHAAGDVKKGFTFEIKRNVDFTQTSKKPTLINLQWVKGEYFNKTMWNNGVYNVEHPGVPVCTFETSAAKAPPPARTLNAVDDLAPAGNPPRKITQRNCQTWVIEATEHLVQDHILAQAVLVYLKAKKQ